MDFVVFRFSCLVVSLLIVDCHRLISAPLQFPSLLLLQTVSRSHFHYFRPWKYSRLRLLYPVFPLPPEHFRLVETYHPLAPRFLAFPPRPPFPQQCFQSLPVSRYSLEEIVRPAIRNCAISTHKLTFC